MSTIQEKASKWDSLIKWIKDTKDEEDTDVWEKLEELGVNASGGEEDRLCPCGDGYKESGCPDGCSGGCCISCCGVGEEEEFECYKCENTHNIKMFSRWEKGFVEEEPNAICKDCEEEVCCGGCNGEICNDCPVDNSSIKDFENVCCKCDEVVPIKYLNGKAKDEMWIECSCGAHDGWYCPDCSPGNDCWDDQDCDCCNPG